MSLSSPTKSIGHGPDRQRPALQGKRVLGVAAVAILAPACAVTAFSVPAWAQATSLPAVTVQAPAPKPAATRPVVKKPAPARREVAARPRRAPVRTARRPEPVPTAPAAPAFPTVASDPAAREQGTASQEVSVQGAPGQGTPGQPAIPGPQAAALGPIDGYVPRVSQSGTKTSTPLIRTPQSISVIGSEQIADQGAQTLVEATRFTSGVVSETFGNDTRNDFLLIRGFPAQVTGYFLDDLQLVSPGFATFRLEPFNLERIEVLKGPASVLYGGSDVGGIVNGVSKRPPLEAHGLVEVAVDNYGNAFQHFDVGGPVSPGPNNHLYYRVEGVHRDGDTQVAFTPADRLSIAPSLTYAPDAATNLTLLGSYEKDRTRGENFLPYVGSVTPASFGRIPTSTFLSDPNIDTFQRNQALIGYAFDHRFNDAFTVRQNLRYSDLRINDRTNFGNGYDAFSANPAVDLERFNFNTTPHLTEFAVDTQGEARFRTGPVANVALAGIDYKRFNFADREGFALGPDIDVTAPVYGTTPLISNTSFVNNFNTQDQLGEYLQEQARYGHFTLVLSGRHDTLTSVLDNDNLATKTSSTKDALTGRVGLIYTTDGGLAPYATYATSFEPQIGTNNSTATPTLLQPQRGELTEVGVKYQPVGSNLSFTGALFNLTETNVLTTDPANSLISLQVGQERSRGFELEAQGSLTDGLKILAAYTGYQIRDIADLNTALIGKVPVGTPQNFGSLFLDYTLQTGLLKGLGAGAGVRYFGGSFADQANTLGVPSYALADFDAHYERGHWRAQFNITNAFDKTFVSTCSSANACFYGQKVRSLFSLAYRW